MISGKHILMLLTLFTAWCSPALAQDANVVEFCEKVNRKQEAKFNLITRAVNVICGTKGLILELREEGQQAFMQKWWGIDIDSYRVTYDKNDIVDSVLVSTYLHSIKDLRTIANSICGFSQNSWRRVDFPGSNRMRGEAKNDVCDADYDNFSRGDGIVSLRIKRTVDTITFVKQMAERASDNK